MSTAVNGALAQETDEERTVREAIKPETAQAESVVVGDKEVRIVPLKRRWQHLFGQAALPMFKIELAATESVSRIVSDGTLDFMNVSSELISGELESDKFLDRAAAVILASKIAGSEKDPEKVIQEQIAWLADNARSEEMRELVEKQADKERLIQQVGERLPARFVRSLHLAGNTGATEDLVRQRLKSFFAKSQDLYGSGNSTQPRPGG